VADWPSLAQSVVTAAAAIGGGVVGARIQKRTTEIQIQAETQRLEQQLKSEREHLELSLGEERLRHRQEIYRSFFDSAHRFHLGAAQIRPFDAAEFVAWIDQYEHDLSGVKLFGTDDAKQAVEDFTQRFVYPAYAGIDFRGF
jgi:hypothetical protein